MTILKRKHKSVETDRVGRRPVYPPLHGVKEKGMLERIENRPLRTTIYTIATMK
jgi:hypothetical protein